MSFTGPLTPVRFRWDGGELDLALAGGVFRPTTTSRLLAEAIELHGGEVVVDAGCGCGGPQGGWHVHARLPLSRRDRP
ncbi:MAG: hypothetical protein ACYDH5_15675 [Acidimicrobiales bacterium]